jgi:hypothetical protein
MMIDDIESIDRTVMEHNHTTSDDYRFRDDRHNCNVKE